MSTRPDLMIVFHVEPADRGVGIMAEGLSAWDASPDAKSWCNVEDCAMPMRFQWYDNETGEACKAPENAYLVEGALQGFTLAHYDQ